MTDIAKTEKDFHEIILRNRKSLDMSGIIEVISFDDISVQLRTQCGELYIEGTELHIHALDTVKGAVSVEGNVVSLLYYDKQADRRGLFGKLSKQAK